ncbi:heat-inducible transcriptional repressor HrcA [Longibaculum muris]|uniref:Heat-inducible transcription repressor HrcA n=1 Tax=Longibaculum muris TaxID=1796628 RepID=A0A4R3YYP1_9FIRM|nr:heat-inducible transcriptional repressor HrcA [Longibaculum muris]KXU40907.1 transcription repressor HrcA [Candidatus Stoquefichus sp. KLE1796]MBS5368418.1 heat-inducible transcription repressor HrcA [Coprobacillus cateniformis]MCR1888661.1 heat-inducible transcriptional repressor HrcA [Longibaculum muris]TCV96998.1 heat-inducible transcription repressor HrcA [Longibaculum muris]
MLTARQLLILKCIVEEFVETAEPVGSKTLMAKYQLPYSSATIRNEMSFLEEHGFLEKTHTSSGRIPSTEGYRFYVNTLMQPSVDDEVKNQVATILGDRHRSLNEIIKESCQMLSELTHLTTVALGPNSGYERLQNITLVPLTEHSVTAIIVTDKGHVENRNFNVKNNAYLEDLTSCVNVMNELLDGTPINQVAFRLERDVKPILSARIKEHEVLFNAFLEAFMKFANSHVYFSGKENLLYQPEYNDVNKLRRLVTAFENSQSWKSLEPIALEEGVSVRIGSDSPIEDLNDVSVISASFKTGNESKGSISVIGPTRMPYEKVVSLVEYISQSLEEVLLSEEDEDDE